MVSLRQQPRRPKKKKTSKESSAGQRVLCNCCNKQVHPRTKFNHSRGKAFTLTLAVAYENKRNASGQAERPESTGSRSSPACSTADSEVSLHSDGAYTILDLHQHNSQAPILEHTYEDIDIPEAMGRVLSPVPSNASSCSDIDTTEGFCDPDDAATFHETITRVQANMARHRVTVEDAEDSDDEEEPQEPDEGEDFDDTTNGFGLEGDMLDEDDLDDLNEEFEQRLADFAEVLSDDELFFLRLYAYKTEEGISDDAYDRLSSVFQGQLPDGKIPSFKSIAARVAFLSAFEPQTYDCCINVCCCYTDPYKELDACPYCNEPRLTEDGKPRRRFNYIPIIPRLQAYYGNASFSQKMNYRHEHASDSNTKVTDVMDGQYYKDLCQQHVVVDNKQRSYKYFEDIRDIFLGLSSDGFAPFRRRKKTCWPLLVYNYNLPPEIRFHLRYILCAGIIPGPNKPKDFDSFAWPLYQELLKLALGVKTYDAVRRELFAMRGYLVLGFGDIPAVSMMMHIKGHNGLCPCRMCRIRALRIPGSKSTTHYVPLDRSSHPLVQATPTMPCTYQPGDLPLRTHQEMREQGSQVLLAPSQTASNELAKEYGVKGIALLSQLPGISFPQSFPYDFMHLIFENVMKNLILLWTGNYKGLDAGSEDYVLNKKSWEDVGKACEAAGSSIPSAFGARPPNIAEDRMAITADTTSFFMQYLGPPLLSRLFNRPKYFKHFIKLVQLVKICLQFEISREEIQLLRIGFQQWVQGYEKIYYQNDPARLPTCPVTIHALLHIADSIEAMGPVWTYWAFPTERYCGKLQRLIKSRRHPFANLDNKVLAQARLSQIRIQYDLNNSFSKPPLTDIVTGRALKGLSSPDYTSCILLPPTSQSDSVDNSLRSKIIICLATRSSMTPTALRRLIVFDGHLTQWACVRRLDGGDDMHASSFVKHVEDRRDATYVRYEQLVDKNAHIRRARSDFELRTFYGQLVHIFSLELPPDTARRLDCPLILFFAAIRLCEVIDPSVDGLGTPYYEKCDRIEVVDMNCVQALIGRLPLRRGWAIIDRSSEVNRAIYNPEEDEE